MRLTVMSRADDLGPEKKEQKWKWPLFYFSHLSDRFFAAMQRNDSQISFGSDWSQLETRTGIASVSKNPESEKDETFSQKMTKKI